MNKVYEVTVNKNARAGIVRLFTNADEAFRVANTYLGVGDDTKEIERALSDLCYLNDISGCGAYCSVWIRELMPQENGEYRCERYAQKFAYYLHKEGHEVKIFLNDHFDGIGVLDKEDGTRMNDNDFLRIYDTK